MVMIAFAGHWRSVTPKRPEDQGWHSSSAREAAAEEHPECPGFNEDEDEIIMIIIILASI